MFTESTWCVVVNQQTCLHRKWRSWQLLLDAHQISYTLHLTQSISELSFILGSLYANHHRYFLFAGGDGTLHHGGNLLIHHAGENTRDLVIGMLPCGTGNDWVKTFGIPRQQIIESLRSGKTAPINVLKLEWPDGSTRYAFNMVGAALDAAVVDSINNSSYQVGSFMKYPFALLRTLMKPHRWKGSVIVDDRAIEGDWLTIEAGFGKYCGGGMYVLPHAKEDKAALLLMKPKSLVKIITSLPKLYNGKISQQKEAMAMHFSKLKIIHSDKAIPLEADGEWLGYTPVTITVEMGIMQRLVRT